MCEAISNTNFSTNDHYLWRATLLLGDDDVHDLLIYASHVLRDKSIMSNFFMACADLVEGYSTPQNLTMIPIIPPLEELLPEPKGKKGNLTKKVNNHQEILPWCYEICQPLEKHHNRLIFHVIVPEQVANLKRVCKEKKVTLSNALAVAFYTAANVVLGKAGGKNGETYRQMEVPLSLTPYLSSQLPPEYQGTLLNILTTTLKTKVQEYIHNSENFWKFVNAYQQEINDKINNFIEYHSRNRTYKKSHLSRGVVAMKSFHEEQQQFCLGLAYSLNSQLLPNKSYSLFRPLYAFNFGSNGAGLYPIYLVNTPWQNQIHSTFVYSERLITTESVSEIIDMFDQIILRHSHNISL